MATVTNTSSRDLKIHVLVSKKIKYMLLFSPASSKFLKIPCHDFCQLLDARNPCNLNSTNFPKFSVA